MSDHTDTKSTPFRFFDNRQKYLMFVTTCSEKWATARRIGEELPHLRPEPPALSVFDAGVGDGTVLSHILRQLHEDFPTVPFLVVGKEISLEDVRLCLEKLPDRFAEHPNMVVVLTNLYYYEAPNLWPQREDMAAKISWREVPLEGNSAHAFDAQVKSLHQDLAADWQVVSSPKTGNPLYASPSVLVLYRKDHRFSLDSIIPASGASSRQYDLVIAAQPYRARLPADKKCQYVLAPLAKSLRPGGRMIVIQSTGRDPGMEIIHRIWPNEQPFQTPRKLLLQELQKQLGENHPDLSYIAYEDREAFFPYNLHLMPTELASHIGTSTLLAAWNAAVYVAQIDDKRLADAMTSGAYLEATRDVLHKEGGLWFTDECFAVARRPQAQT